MGEATSPIERGLLNIAIKDEKYWLYDGSIVLWQENSLFRVHQTVLANSSEIFSTLFTLPQSTNDVQEFIEGCPIVMLHDRAQDFQDLLNALYNPSHFDDFPADAELNTILDFISGILRLATKYMIQSLRRKCISLFTRTLPATLEECDGRASRGPLTSKHLRSDVIMRAIRLAQETDVPTVLPYASYCLARLPSRRILEQRPGDISWQQKTEFLMRSRSKPTYGMAYLGSLEASASATTVHPVDRIECLHGVCVKCQKAAFAGTTGSLEVSTGIFRDGNMGDFASGL
ncbi:hypothetical protein D9757_011187 [Collybiopsis confluens]|uniref:BTB domain-containing protein n=1 Tax=Collybiopsis confluens TaxID=2823264 RepID=A0A8H5H384_9AGAR|nr:hypothetical protein D9757_011187 [Collybiopsis confluens]